MSVERVGGNMHRKYIRKIFLGEIHPANSCKFENEEYEKWQTEFTKLYREIQALLPDDQKNAGAIMRRSHCNANGNRYRHFATALNWAQIL